MRLFRVIVPVGDIDAAATFYGAVWSSPGERVSGNRHYFDAGEVVLACMAPPSPTPNPEHLYLAVDEPLDAVRDRWVAAGGALEDDIRHRDWGEDSFYGIDPWGNRLCFVAAGTEFTGGRFVP